MRWTTPAARDTSAERAVSGRHSRAACWQCALLAGCDAMAGRRGALGDTARALA